MSTSLEVAPKKQNPYAKKLAYLSRQPSKRRQAKDLSIPKARSRDSTKNEHKAMWNSLESLSLLVFDDCLERYANVLANGFDNFVFLRTASRSMFLSGYVPFRLLESCEIPCLCFAWDCWYFGFCGDFLEKNAYFGFVRESLSLSLSLSLPLFVRVSVRMCF